MRYRSLALAGLVLIESEPIEDARGFFARLFDRDEMAANGVLGSFEQESLARNARAGTIRGLHYQRDPDAETKLVACVRGRIFDVLVDLRPNSATYGEWTSVQLDSATPSILYVPPGFAHGYQTLAEESDVYYHIAPAYKVESAAGFNALSTKLGIAWPLDVTSISERDRNLPEFA